MSAALRVVVECAAAGADADLEIEGPDFELCSWLNPLPAFGGVLSFEATGMNPEEFAIRTLPRQPLTVRVKLHYGTPSPVRVTITEQWGRPGAKIRVILMTACRPGTTEVAKITPE
jgi:hypothetical protein